MALLKETEEALFEFPGDPELDWGIHVADEVVYDRGKIDGEEEFDLLVHDPISINHLSVMGIITEKDYVEKRLPQTSMDIQFISHHHIDKSNPAILDRKRRLVRSLIDQMLDSLPSAEDVTSFYDVGTAMPAQTLEEGEEVIVASDKEAAEVIADICLGGMLNFVMSDFEKFPVDGLAGRFKNAVAIKLNDFTDLKVDYLKKGNIEYRIGELKALNPSNEAEMKLFNNGMLDEHHASLIARMKAAGFMIAEVVYDPGNRFYFDVPRADSSIAAAINEVAGK